MLLSQSMKVVMKAHMHDGESVSSEIEVMREAEVKNLGTDYVTSFLSQFPHLLRRDSSIHLIGLL